MDDTTALHRMDGDRLSANARDLERDLEWFATVLDARLKAYFQVDGAKTSFYLPPPPLDRSDSPYATFLHEHDVTPQIRLVILLALIPHLRPQLLDVLWTRNEATARGFPEFGGSPASHQGFVPTGETAAFLLAGADLSARFSAMQLFDHDAFLVRNHVVHLAPVGPGESRLSGTLILSPEFLQRFTSGQELKPGFHTDFPARLLRSELEWRDLVLPQTTLNELDEIRQWILHRGTLLSAWGMGRKLRPGFTSLFYGHPGTGKSLSACLLGKLCGTAGVPVDVYRVDLSLVVSKYIGETEKNLARIFDAAEHKGWILFFDEADALFGKRTRVDDAHDRYANQEVSFLLQRIEEFDGVAILASNAKTNIDEAFLRRFDSIVYFPMPKATERMRLWREALPAAARLDARIDLGRFAEKYELTGGTIMNVVRHAALMALGRGTDTIDYDDVEEGVRREYVKEGRAL